MEPGTLWASLVLLNALRTNVFPFPGVVPCAGWVDGEACYEAQLGIGPSYPDRPAASHFYRYDDSTKLCPTAPSQPACSPPPAVPSPRRRDSFYGY